jgi:hypothetical protein
LYSEYFIALTICKLKPIKTGTEKFSFGKSSDRSNDCLQTDKEVYNNKVQKKIYNKLFPFVSLSFYPPPVLRVGFVFFDV